MIERCIQIWRYVWASPYTLLGLWCVLVPWSGARSIIRYRGTIGIVGPAIERALRRAPIPGGAAALTLGHSILATSSETFFETWEHEYIHVKQYERWGVLFVPAYLLSGLWLRIHGKDPYWDNPFEREAREQS